MFISSRFSCTACHSPLSSVWSLSSSAPWKPSESWQKCTSAHTRPYSLQKGQSIWILLFQQLLAGMAKAQDWVCVAETTAFYRLGDKNDWMANASSLTDSMELRSLIAVTHSGGLSWVYTDDKTCSGLHFTITSRVCLTCLHFIWFSRIYSIKYK